MSDITIAIVEDQPLMMTALTTFLSASTDFKIVAFGVTAADMIRLARFHVPRLMILSPSVPDETYDAIRTIRNVLPAIKIVAYTSQHGVDHAVRALDAGAHGYVLKRSSADELMAAVRAVLKDETYITQGFAVRVIDALRNTDVRHRVAEAIKLSQREGQIVRLLLRGMTNKEIAATLRITEKTVKHYMTELMQKMQARNRVEVIIAAQRMSEYRLQSLDA
ncbi:two-component system nitrate/nitrite response regulator NarL [Bradyrhizobium sp. JR7.2]|jgi:DNA-binding NarL/FixJ family response regulator|uniref:DNA-binding response regulator n=2 Tax=Bradyrhizobium TaxID=374 RepID=A0A1L3F6J3_BRAJP|nr:MULTISPECIES: response regulator transcription factor [Bradyrhizobium]APG08903.1 DNA-binding response regulator [Bradyrhizobium japonicum]MCS3927187.1 DNA-binding NarL/FixJ family response regulator [Bradyrhizobium elkanii]MCS3967740.1 DNA-binding NarL/FixJ family response regulator [Bradyrhizobium japonicum]UFW85020.1 response regulator transcription factor [Bradyrhizobium japonicum]